MHRLDLVPHVLRQGTREQQLEMHLQSRERRTELMRCVGEKALLNGVGVTKFRQQMI